MHYAPETFEAIVNLLPGYVCWKDHQHVYLGCNNLYAKGLGLGSRQDIIGKTDKDLPWRLHAEAFEQLEQQVMEKGIPITVEEQLPIRSNPHATFIIKRTPLRNSQGAIMGILAVAIDISQMKHEQQEWLVKAQKQYEVANQAKTAFIHNLEHDIRTPFAGIINVAQYLVSDESDEQKRKQLADIAISAEKLLGYFNEVLDISYQTSGQLSLAENKFDIRELIIDLLAIHKPSASSKGLKIITTIAPDLPGLIVSDSYRIERILLNLLGNAIKFTDKGFVQVSVEVAKKVDLRHVILKLTVEDSGVGIAEEHLDRIFDKFSRLTPSYQGCYPGTGMGLFLVKQFMNELGGEIDVNSVLQKGTCFHCLIPVKIPLLTEEPEASMMIDLDSI